MKIAIEGCAHGDLENIYDTIYALEQKNGFKVDLLICCGDFQSSRNQSDLMCMAVPPKYRNICTFYKYYSGEKTAPVLTIFIGGNHEASNYLQELPYGGWVAPNIYYLGYAGVINVAGIRIGGISGIFKGNDYFRGHYEIPPYTEQSKRTVYHVRNLEIFRIKQISGKIDIFLSHDWPSDVVKFGNVEQLLKRKPLFREDIDKGELGSKMYNDVLYQLKPKYWFSAHLHCKFPALIKHTDNSITKFLALDKCLPKRRFLQIVDIPHNEESKIEISYDIEWLTILYATNHLLSTRNTLTYMPGPGSGERYDFTPNEDEKSNIIKRFNSNLVIPKIYYQTASPYSCDTPSKHTKQPQPVLNPQTTTLCEILSINDPLAEACKSSGAELNASVDLNSSISFLDDTVDNEGSLDSSQDISLRKLSSIHLPDPKLDESDSQQMLEDEDNEESVSVSGKNDCEEDKIAEEAINEAEETVNRNSPTPKKFKRRNKELYAGENDQGN